MLYKTLLLILTICAATLLSIPPPAHAQISEFKLLPFDGAAGDNFGFSVSISGDYAVVGALADQDNGSSSGSAYIFRRTDTSWTQEAKLLPSDGAAGDWFGFSVSISGDYAVVGARQNDGHGSAYVFKRSGTSWAQEAKLLASDGAAGDQFGYSVSISGDYAVVGAILDDDNGSLSGSAYIFTHSGTNWVQEAKLLPSDGAAGDQFGNSVSISGNYAIVGAWVDDDNGTRSGSAYVFKRTGTSWTQEAKLLPSDGAASDFFGTSVSISGDYAVVGSQFDDDNGDRSGSAYLFKRSDTTWTQVTKLLASDGSASNRFGFSVSISGDYVVVGAVLDNDNGPTSGSAYLYNGFILHDPFVSNSILDIFIDEDFGLIAIALLDTVFYDFDLPNDSLRYSLSISSGIVSGNISGDTLWIFSVANLNGMTEVVVTATDDSSTSVSDTFLITVRQVNDAPVLSNLPDVVFNEDEIAVIHFSDWFAFVDDPDNADSTLEWSLDSGAADSVSFIIQGDSVIFEAPQDWFAFDRDTIQVNISDGFLSDSIRLAVNVMPVNDPPMFIDFPDTVTLIFDQNDTLILSEFVLDIDDPDSLLLWSQFACVGADSIVCVTTNADTAFIQPVGNFSGTAEFEFWVTDTSGASDTVSIIIYVMEPIGINDDNLIPLEYSLSNNYPNPFNPQTVIRYAIPVNNNVTLVIYNLMGHEVMLWKAQNVSPGFYEYTWHGINQAGNPVASGIYLYRLVAGDFVQTKKMLLLK